MARIVGVDLPKNNRGEIGRTYIYGIVGDVRDLDLDFLRTLGPVEVLSLEEIFGY